MTRKKHKKRTRKLLSFFMIPLAAIIALGIIAGALICIFTEPIDTSMLSIKMSSTIYYEDDSGRKIILQNLYSDENRTWVDFEKIPLNMKNAFVAIEDERFYSHPGFDAKRLAGATLNTFLRIFDKNRSVYGGSTITQQLVKNLTKEDERSVLRKFKEIYRAVRLEGDLSKNEILELYMNTIYLSQNCNGVGAAAKIYFNKEVSKLSLAECASIAGITQYPSLYDPYLNPEANKEKQEIVLTKMLELDMISQAEYSEAMAEELVFTRAEEFGNSHYSYFIDTVIEEVLSDLSEKYNYSEAMAQNLLYTGGLQIKCTIDPEMQAILEEVYTQESNYTYKNGELMQSAMVITEASTGEIKGIVGGMGEKNASRTYNRATALRQPGSSIKPLAVYAPALDKGIIHGASVLTDVPTTFRLADGSTWTPRNSGGGFSGDVSLRTAIARSLNVPAAKLLDEMGIEESYNFLAKNLGITSLVEAKNTEGGVVSDKALAALSLGGLTDGVSPIEISGAYATFINHGYYIEPHSYTEIYDYAGKILFHKNPETHRAMKDSTAAIMTDLMKSVVSGGTGTSARFSGVDIAGKTGTTTNDHDKWFVGITPSLVGVTWVGYDVPSAINSSVNPATTLWKKVMSQIDYSNEPADFDDVLSYDSLKRHNICTVSGKYATTLCTELETVYSVYLDRDSVNKLERCSEDEHLEEETEEEKENTDTEASQEGSADAEEGGNPSVPAPPSVPEISPEPSNPNIPAPPSVEEIL